MLKAVRRLASQTAPPLRSVPGHRPPVAAETVFGRYSGVLFSAASRAEKLDSIHAELQQLAAVVAAPRVRAFIENISHTREEQRSVLAGLTPQVDPLIASFLEQLVENRKLSLLPQIIAEFGDYFRALNRQESVKVISAQPLRAEQREALEETLRKKLAGGSFTIEYELDPALLGGFHIYFGNRFLDCSLATRVAALRAEFQRLAA